MNISAPPRGGALFAGYGGLELAVQRVLPAVRTAWVAEIDAAPAHILATRFPDAPNLGDVTAVDWDAVDPIEIATGGFPCQDVSIAGNRRGLRDGTRSGLWYEMARGIQALRPGLVLIENVRGLLSAEADGYVEPCPWCVGTTGDGEPAMRALGAVLADLAELGYDSAWCGVRASDVGAAHGRYRIFVLGWDTTRTGGLDWLPTVQDTDRTARDQRGIAAPGQAEGWWPRADAGGRSRAPAIEGLNLLPTPAVNDMGAGKTVEDWDAWTARMRAVHGNGNGHGKSLAIEALRGEFGQYAHAIERWGRTIGRPAPPATEPTGKGGAHRLSPCFVEWLMGLPDGWVTDVGLTAREQMKALGNGVVPQQAAAALRYLLGVREFALSSRFQAAA